MSQKLVKLLMLWYYFHQIWWKVHHFFWFLIVTKFVEIFTLAALYRMSVRMSVSHWETFLKLLTLADEDTNANSAIQGNVAMHMMQPGD